MKIFLSSFGRMPKIGSEVLAVRSVFSYKNKIQIFKIKSLIMLLILDYVIE